MVKILLFTDDVKKKMSHYHPRLLKINQSISYGNVFSKHIFFV